ncbi:MAG: hypothetical protein WC299_14230, partial [Kiritimatiellia bacterium]
MKPELFNRYRVWMAILRFVELAAMALWLVIVLMVCRPWHSLPALIWVLSVPVIGFSLIISGKQSFPVNRKRSDSPRSRLA